MKVSYLKVLWKSKLGPYWPQILSAKINYLIITNLWYTKSLACEEGLKFSVNITCIIGDLMTQEPQELILPHFPRFSLTQCFLSCQQCFTTIHRSRLAISLRPVFHPPRCKANLGHSQCILIQLVCQLLGKHTVFNSTLL